MIQPLSGSTDALRRSEVRALRVAQEAAAHVPAYARFLRLAGYDPTRLRSFADFCELPPTDKVSYLTRYPLDQRCRGRDLPRAHIVTVSSGSAGPATLWPRFPEQDAQLFAAVTAVLQEHFRIRERWTLLVLAQAMGAWGFGVSMNQVAQRLFAEPRVRGTVVTPGLNQDEVIRFVEQLSPNYDQTIIASYPAVLPSLLDLGQERGIRWPELNVGMFTSGEPVSEAQREAVLRRVGKDPERLEGFVAVFGASEVAGLIGAETRLCLLIRRLCARTPALAEALFDSPVVPSIVQYNPLSAFLETRDGEILLTARGAEPLIRYNTHDRGGLMSAEEMLVRCRLQGVDLLAELQARGLGAEAYRPLPFLYVFGRSDAVIMHGANVYKDHLAHVLEETSLHATNTGNFELSAVTDPDGRGTLQVDVELSAGVEPTDALRLLYEESILQGLQRLNAGFRTVYQASNGRITAAVTLLPFGQMALRGPKRQRSASGAGSHATGGGSNGAGVRG